MTSAYSIAKCILQAHLSGQNNLTQIQGSFLCVVMQVTKTQVAEILDSKAAELVNNVEALLLAVKSTNDFEAEMARRFGGTTSEDSEHEVT